MSDDDAPTRALFEAPPLPELERMVEAILFASGEPLTRPQIEERLPHGADAAAAIEALRRRYEGRGVNLARIGPGWAFRNNQTSLHARACVVVLYPKTAQKQGLTSPSRSHQEASGISNPSARSQNQTG